MSKLKLQTVKMKKSRFTETQVISILKEYDGGMKAEDVPQAQHINGDTV